MSGILIILLICNVGCGPQRIELSESIETNQLVKQISKQEKNNQLTETHFMNFFKAYFSFSEEELLILNQKRAQVDELYWSHLRQYYGPFIKSKLAPFLAEDLVTKLETQYLFDEITLPKWVFINEYMVQGGATVEHIEIRSVRDLGENIVYELALTTVNTCYPVSEFIAHYAWGEEEGYFISKSSDQNGLVGTLYETNLEAMNKQSYLYSQEEDELKLKQLFWVTVSKQNPLKIRSVRHAEAWETSPSQYKMLLDSKYITRIPYKEEVSQEEKDLLNLFFEALMTKDKDFYKYYEKAYDTSVSAFQRMWEDMGLGSQMDIQETYYKETFPTSIIPYKDAITLLTIQQNGIQIKPSVYSTKKQPRYVVTVLVEALLNNNQKVYYNYKYFVGIENKKIEFIQFMSINEIEAEDYTGV